MMKEFKTMTLVLLLFMAMFAMSSCGNRGNQTTPEETTEQQSPEGVEHTAAYVCPMHCTGSGSDQAGSCPVCGMDYVKREDHIADGHVHEESAH